MAQKKSEIDSITDSQDANPRELDRGMAELLGPNPLKRKEPADLCLLRITSGDLSLALAERLGAETWTSGQETLLKKGKPALVLGPYTWELLSELAREKLIVPQDYLLRAYDRWKSVAVSFADLKNVFGHLEDTTDTATGPGVRAPFVEGEKTEAMELESLEETQTHIEAHAEGSVEEPLLYKLEVEEPDEVVQPIQKEAMQALKDIHPNEGRLPTATEIEERLRKVRPLRATELRGAPAFLTSLPFTLGSIVAVLAVALAALNKDKILSIFHGGEAKTSEAPNDLSQNFASQDPNTKSYPDDLKPLEPESLYANTDDYIVEKIRPILNSAERGNQFLNSDQQSLLKRYAAAGTASWTAQQLAANQLAVYYISVAQFDAAHRYLDPIYQAASTDAVTILNKALLSLVEGSTSNARTLADAGVRLIQPDLRWVAHLIDGLVVARSGDINEAERLYNSAREASSYNPFVLGIWIQSLSQAGVEWRNSIPKLGRELLWADQDRLLDSPIKAPLAGALLVNQALDGFRELCDHYGSTFKPGHIAFLRWIESRRRLNPLATPITQVSTILSQEDDNLSRFLYAYTLKELGKTSEALAVMKVLVKNLESGNDIKTSYPWSFAGELALGQGQYDEGMAYFDRALKLNRSDVAAVHGMAMTLRAKGDFGGARQKLAETLSLDPSFIPAKLRQTRFDWHARLQSK